MKNKKSTIQLILMGLVIIVMNSKAQVKILFDNRKAESAGNADWVIDADVHNLSFSSSGAITTTGTESNAQRIPTPAQSGITASTAETFWNGGISALAVDMAKKGYIVESLPYNASLTYSNSTNVQDLSNYKVYVVCEPNIVFTAAEKTAIMNFVKNGGGLYMISDHSVSDRNNDGWDSPKIWTDLMKNNSVQNNPFGIDFDTTSVTGNFSGTFTNVSSNLQDSLLHGPGGNVTEVLWANGTRMTLNPANNASVVGDVYKTSPASGNTNVLVAHAHYFKGKVAAIGDSSPFDDGTGDSNDVLYNGYFTDASGNHQKLLINTIIWLATSSGVATSVTENSRNDFSVVLYPNPVNNELNLITKEKITSVEIISYLGQKTDAEIIDSKINTEMLSEGCYIIRIVTEKGVMNKSFIKAK
ncbi:MAG: T9SS type A sorting domain-containing protein [Bacteroidetes bacterium]|nr:T9SS type A sorting domain-containing protein [Bacteroidota bacterium]